MAQVKLLKIASDGLPLEFNSTADDITLNSYTVQGGGPVLSGTGLDLNNQDLSDVSDIDFNDPSVSTIEQTAGALIIDNIMAKDRANAMASTADIQFGVITDAVGEVDSLVLPKLAGAPTAVPTGGEGSFLYDSTNDKLWLYTTAGWDDLSTVASAANIDDTYTAGVGGVAARDVVYISAADTVLPAVASAANTSQAVGFATAAALAAATATVRKFGRLSGFSGLTPAARYYLDATTPGAITSTTPAGTGNTIIQVGYAKSATVLDIMIESLGRRA
jgi:hypothetical protein